MKKESKSNSLVLIIMDGLGDEEIPELDHQTPLEAAHTPTFDKWAKEGLLGEIKPHFSGAFPTSEEGHFSLFGYDPIKYGLSRGIVTAGGSGIELKKGDIAIRGNFSTFVDGKIIDRRAGRINETKDLIAQINGIVVDDVEFIVKSAGEYRLAIVIRGSGLSSTISDGDPHYKEGKEGVQEIRPLDNSSEACRTATTLNKFIEKSHLLLCRHPQNKDRELPANYILTRGAGEAGYVPEMKEKYKVKAACVAGKDLYKEIARVLGMDVLSVKGANGFFDTNLEGKFKEVKRAIEKGYDFVFLHIKATDSLAEDGDFLKKRDFIEKIDKEASLLDNFQGLIAVTSDHCTCSLLKRHCPLNIPLLIRGRGEDDVQIFSEKECKRGSLGVLKQLDLMKEIFFILEKKEIL